MPAAESTDYPEPAHGAGAAVIRLAERTRRLASARRSEPPAAGCGESSPLQQLAETIERIFLARGETLTDEATARSYGVTLEAVSLMVRSAAARGHLSEEQLELLSGMLGDMAAVPEAV
jgi:hypothetical protein